MCGRPWTSQCGVVRFTCVQFFTVLTSKSSTGAPRRVCASRCERAGTTVCKLPLVVVDGSYSSRVGRHTTISAACFCSKKCVNCRLCVFGGGLRTLDISAHDSSRACFARMLVQDIKGRVHTLRSSCAEKRGSLHIVSYGGCSSSAAQAYMVPFTRTWCTFPPLFHISIQHNTHVKATSS